MPHSANVFSNVNNDKQYKAGIYAIIPALNEQNTIASVVRSVSAYAANVVVVDDGSVDSTGQIASSCGAHTIVHPVNQGYDRSIDDAFSYDSVQPDARIVFTFDADGQHRSDILPKLLRPLLNNEADIAAGIRPSKARLSERILGVYTRLKYGLVDPMCGLKAYRIEVFRDIGYFDHINSIGSELMLRAVKKGYRVAQIPIPIEPRADASRFGNVIRGNYKIFKAFLRIIINVR